MGRRTLIIVPPIILQDSDGYLSFFDSADEAVANLDLDDVVDREYTAYDSDGRLLAVEPTTDASSVARIESRETTPSHQEQLRAALLRALRLKGVDGSAVGDDLPLPRLLTEALERKRGHGLP